MRSCFKNSYFFRCCTLIDKIEKDKQKQKNTKTKTQKQIKSTFA